VCELTPDGEVRLDLDARSVRAARRFLREASCLTHAAGLADEAELLVSELVTNAVRHGLPPIVLRVACDRRHDTVIQVLDGNPAGPQRQQAGAEQESGRGIGLVEMVSAQWGVESGADGKSVWFRLSGAQE
jgi:anti-sigma regulatory factor (Ser/Thr protein kinase)